jgi:hypothetical protein
MSQPLAVGMVLQGRAWCRKDDQVSVTTLHHRVDAASGPVATDVDFLTAWDVIWAAWFKAAIGLTDQYLGSTMQILSPGPIGLQRATIASAGAGTGTGFRLPSQTSGLIQWGTNIGGRQNKGRIYVPFPTAVWNNTDGFPATGYLILLDDMGSEYVTHTAWTLASGSQTINPVLVHRRNKAGVIPSPSLISTWKSANQWATQRKRGAFGRANNAPF